MKHIDFPSHLMNNEDDVFEALLLAFHGSIQKYLKVENKDRHYHASIRIGGFETKLTFYPTSDFQPTDILFQSTIHTISFDLLGKISPYNIVDAKLLGNFYYKQIVEQRVVIYDRHDWDDYQDLSSEVFIEEFGEDRYKSCKEMDFQTNHWWKCLVEGTMLKALEVM